MVNSLSNIADETTEKTNTAGVLTPILEIDPTDGTIIQILNQVARGDEMGVPIYADLRNGSNDVLPQDTQMALQFEAPTDDSPQTVSNPKKNIRAYNALSIKDQQNEEYVDRVKHVLKGTSLVIDDVDTAYVSLLSSEQINWSNSRLQFDESAVREV